MRNGALSGENQGGGFVSSQGRGRDAKEEDVMLKKRSLTPTVAAARPAGANRLLGDTPRHSRATSAVDRVSGESSGCGETGDFVLLGGESGGRQQAQSKSCPIQPSRREVQHSPVRRTLHLKGLADCSRERPLVARGTKLTESGTLTTRTQHPTLTSRPATSVDAWRLGVRLCDMRHVSTRVTAIRSVENSVDGLRAHT